MSAFAAVRLAPRPSRTLAVALVAAHSATLGALACSGLAAGVRAAIALAVVASLLHGLREHVLRAGDALVQVEGTPGGRWRVVTAARGAADATLRSDNLVLPWLTVLAFRLADGRRRCLVLCPDSVPADDFRRLRVLVRHAQALPAAAPGGHGVQVRQRIRQAIQSLRRGVSAVRRAKDP